MILWDNKYNLFYQKLIELLIFLVLLMVFMVSKHFLIAKMSLNMEKDYYLLKDYLIYLLLKKIWKGIEYLDHYSELRQDMFMQELLL